MSFLNPCHKGLAYGDGHMQGDGQTAHIVKIAGNDLFTVNTNPEDKSFGILIKDYKAGEMPGIYTGGGVYETDVFEGTITPGNDLKVSATGKLTGGTITSSEHVIAKAISVQSGVLKFRLLI